MKNIKVVMDDVVDNFENIANGGFEARHDALLRESSIDAYKLNKALGLASADCYRARYIALLACIIDYLDKSESISKEIIDKIELLKYGR